MMTTQPRLAGGVLRVCETRLGDRLDDELARRPGMLWIEQPSTYRGRRIMADAKSTPVVAWLESAFSARCVDSDRLRSSFSL